MYEKNIEMTYDNSVCKYLAKSSSGAKSGARDLRNRIRKNIEDKITKLYNKTINGDKNSRPIEIPKDPSAPFKTPETILKVLEDVKDKSNLSPNEVYKQIVEPCEKTINKIKSTSKSR